MSYQLSLYVRALRAWRSVLVKQHTSALRDKETTLRDGLRRKLAEMFGDDYHVEMEGPHDNDELVTGAVIEHLSFVALRAPSGEIAVYLLMPCPRCRHQMMSDTLTNLADLGRALMYFEAKGTLGDDACPCAGGGDDAE